MKHFLSAFFVLIFTSSFSQRTVEMFSSQKLGVDREIMIQLPKSYEKDTKRSYPLLFLLDADYLFDPFSGAVSYGNYWDDLPEIIIVGVSQNFGGQRYTDSKSDDVSGLPIETGAAFFDFIGAELMPHLSKNYRIAPFKIIAGHDVTAGFLNFFLYKEIPVFDAYISLAPEFATEMENRIPDRLSAITKPIYYYLATSDGDVKKLQKRIKDLDLKTKEVNNPLLNYKFDDFKGASHYSLVLNAIPSALYQFFSVYQPITTNEFNDKIVKMESGYVNYLKEKYEALEKSLNIKMPIRINDFKAIEAAILKNKAYNEFDELAQLADKNYPKTMLYDYHMAMMYEKKGDLKKAQKYYRNAFVKEEIGDLTKNMMLDRADELKRQDP